MVDIWALSSLLITSSYSYQGPYILSQRYTQIKWISDFDIVKVIFQDDLSDIICR